MTKAQPEHVRRPDMLCQELQGVLVNPVTARSHEVTESGTLYCFKAGISVSRADISILTAGCRSRRPCVSFPVTSPSCLRQSFQSGTFVPVYTTDAARILSPDYDSI